MNRNIIQSNQLHINNINIIARIKIIENGGEKKKYFIKILQN